MQIIKPAHWHTAWTYVTTTKPEHLEITATPTTTTLQTFNRNTWLQATIPNQNPNEPHDYKNTIKVEERTTNLANQAKNARSTLFDDPHITLNHQGDTIQIRLADDDAFGATARIEPELEFPNSSRILDQPPEPTTTITPAPERLTTLGQVLKHTGHNNTEINFFETPKPGAHWQTNHHTDPQIQLAGAIDFSQ